MADKATAAFASSSGALSVPLGATGLEIDNVVANRSDLLVDRSDLVGLDRSRGGHGQSDHEGSNEESELHFE